MTRRFVHTAMATRFDLWLCGSEEQLLADVASEVWREVDRLDLLMSRHDPRAEITRINREAHERAVRVEIELFDILEDARRWFEATEGYFDVTAREGLSNTAIILANHATFRQPYELDRSNRTVRISSPKAAFDLGGYGKGYSLDRVRTLLDRYERVKSAFIQAGSSSALAAGSKEDGSPWLVFVPESSHADNPSRQRTLRDQGFSCSAAFHQGEYRNSDIIDPKTGRRLTDSAVCWVVASTALEAEVLSTALIAMGREKAERFVHGYENEAIAAGRVDGARSSTPYEL